MKRVFLCFTLALSAILLSVLPVMASFHQEPQGGTLPQIADWDSVNVTTLPATNIIHNSATLNASTTIVFTRSNDSNGLIYVDVDHRYITGHFQYGTSSGVYTSITPNVTKEYFLTNPTTVFASTITGLRPCTKYYARFVVSSVTLLDYQKQLDTYLISYLSPGPHGEGMHGLGVGLGFIPAGKQMLEIPQSQNIYGNEIIFTTIGCQVSTGPIGQGGSVGTGAPSVTITNPVQISNIVVQSAAIAATKVAPGEKVDVTASISNKGGANGDAKVTLYVNGQEVESQGVTVASGQTSPVHFSLSMNEPGTYTVIVGNVVAGSLTVDAFANNDLLIYGLIALFTIGIALVIYMVTRKRTA